MTQAAPSRTESQLSQQDPQIVRLDTGWIHARKETTSVLSDQSSSSSDTSEETEGDEGEEELEDDPEILREIVRQLRGRVSTANARAKFAEGKRREERQLR